MDTADGDRWWWAAKADAEGVAGDRFVIALGQDELWRRVRAEISPDERCSWHGFGRPGGFASLADCFRVHLTGRETYGANLNRVVLELARVPAYAKFLRESTLPLVEHISNPIGLGHLARQEYDEGVARALERRIGATLGGGA